MFSPIEVILIVIGTVIFVCGLIAYVFYHIFLSPYIESIVEDEKNNENEL